MSRPDDAVLPDPPAELDGLLEAHREPLLRYIRRRLAPLAGRLDPEDVLQAVWANACQRWHSFREQPADLQPVAWLYRLTRDAVAAAFRHEQARCRDQGREVALPDGSSLQLAMNLISPDTSPSSAVAREELLGRLEAALGQLPPAERLVLELRSLDELPEKEVAGLLGVDERTVRRRLRRALEELKRAWDLLHPNDRGRP